MPADWDVKAAELLIAGALAHVLWTIVRLFKDFPAPNAPPPAPVSDEDDQKELAEAKKGVKGAKGEPDYDHDIVTMPCGGTVDFESIPEKTKAVQCSKGCTHTLREVRAKLDQGGVEAVRWIAGLVLCGPPLLMVSVGLAYLEWRGKLGDYGDIGLTAALLCGVPFLLMRVLPMFLVKKD